MRTAWWIPIFCWNATEHKLSWQQRASQKFDRVKFALSFLFYIATFSSFMAVSIQTRNLFGYFVTIWNKKKTKFHCPQWSFAFRILVINLKIIHILFSWDKLISFVCQFAHCDESRNIIVKDMLSSLQIQVAF